MFRCAVSWMELRRRGEEYVLRWVSSYVGVLDIAMEKRHATRVYVGRKVGKDTEVKKLDF